MKIIPYLSALLLVLLQACQQPAAIEMKKQVQVDTMQLIMPPAQSVIKVIPNEMAVACYDSITNIRFNDCYFSLNWIKPDEQQNNFELHPDTLFFKLERNRSLEGQLLLFTTNKTAVIKVAQCYETSAVIEDQLLHNWKHYHSHWEKLVEETNHWYVCKQYTAKEIKQFPPTTINELQKFVKERYPASMHARIAQHKSFPLPPVRIIISRYYLKLDIFQKKEAAKTTKLLVIDVI